jgi:hypothetical protein
MTRIRLIMLSLLAVFAISAVASASASAVTECETVGAPVEPGGDIALCIQGKEVGSPTEHAPVPFISKKTTATTSRLTVAGGGPIIECTAAANKGEWDIRNGNIKNSENVEASDLVITFTGCKIVNSVNTREKCTVNSPGSPDGTIVVDGGGDGLDGFFPNASESNPVPITFEPSQGEVFVIIKIGNKNGTCPLPTGEFNIKGKQKAKTGTSTADACQSRQVHTLKVLATESELKFGASETAATFELTEDVELTSKEAWGLCDS